MEQFVKGKSKLKKIGKQIRKNCIFRAKNIKNLKYFSFKYINFTMINRINYTLKGLSDTQTLAAFIAKLIQQSKKEIFLIFLKGDLGSGKTTFARFLLNNLGVSDKEFEGSPTFTIVNEYKNNIFHIDLYRIQSKYDMETSGVMEYFTKNGIIIVEWPEILDFKADLCIKFTIKDKFSRIVNVYKR